MRLPQHIVTYSWVLFSLFALWSCNGDEDDVSPDPSNDPQATDYAQLLTNQIDEVIIPSAQDYASKMLALKNANESFAASIDAAGLLSLKSAYHEAYKSYQMIALHDYYATANQNLVHTTNMYPVDTNQLNNFIANSSYSFNTTHQERANGFPALDFLLYGHANTIAYFQADQKRLDFMTALINAMQSKADNLFSDWSGSLRDNFINNGGTALGTSISVQLNQSLIYYETHIRENKVGIPIGRLGPNDSPIAADSKKIEAYYQSQSEGNESFTLELLSASIQAMERLYLGTTSTDQNGQGYDDLLAVKNQASIDADIKNAFANLYSKINNRSSISGDETLYNGIQNLVTLYKSDLFPILNVQDADGANDGD